MIQLSSIYQGSFSQNLFPFLSRYLLFFPLIPSHLLPSASLTNHFLPANHSFRSSRIPIIRPHTILYPYFPPSLLETSFLSPWPFPLLFYSPYSNLPSPSWFHNAPLTLTFFEPSSRSFPSHHHSFHEHRLSNHSSPHPSDHFAAHLFLSPVLGKGLRLSNSKRLDFFIETVNWLK